MTENVGIKTILTFYFKFILFAGTFFPQISSFAQNTNNWSNNIPNAISPTAFEFTKYGDVPVGNYTGVPNIDIPIYTIEAAGLALPISLSYHSNGIRVSEEASSVGLGWTLNAGGSIVQVVNEFDDFGSNSRGSEIDISKVTLPPELSDLHDKEILYSLETGGFQLPDEVIKNMVDSEPDIFKFNFLNYSGDFLYDKKLKKFVCLDHTNIQITSDLPNGGLPYPQYFYISVPEGHKFVFQLKDITKIKQSFGYTEKGGTSSPINLIGEASSRLYQLIVINTNKGEEILFDYTQTAEVNNYPSISYSYSRNERTPYEQSGPLDNQYFPNSSNSTNFFATSQTNTYLKSITSDKVFMEFTPSTRLDISSALKLDQILIENKASSLVKKISLTYDYFQSNIAGSTTENTLDSYLTNLGISKSDNEKRLRLKLVSLKEDDLNPYTFVYSSTLLPSKTSLAYDPWGFYNGQFEYSTLMDRANSYEDYIGAAILKVVNYPTGGGTVFQYQMNDLSDVVDPHPHYNAEKGKVFIQDNNYNNPYQDQSGALVYKVGPQSFWLLVPLNADVKIQKILSLDGTCSANPNGLPDYPNAHWEIRSYNAQTADLVEFNGWQTIPSFVTNSNYLISSDVGTIKLGEKLYKDWGTTSGSLPKGVYFFSVDLNDVCGPQNTTGQNGFAYLSLEYRAQESFSNKGAGLRIQEITDYDENGNPVKAKVFTYAQPVLMTPVFYDESQFYEYDYDFPEPNGYCSAYRITGHVRTKHGQPVFTPSTSASGRYVGYSNVTVKEYSDGIYTGKISYFYQNLPDHYNYYDLPPIRSILGNGLLLRESHSTTGDILLKEVNYSYTAQELPSYLGIRTFWRQRLFLNTMDCQFSYMNIYDLGFYSILRTQSFLNETSTKAYSGVFSLETKESYSYDSYNQIIKKSLVDSKGNLSETLFTYPYNYPTDPVATQMTNENHIASLVTTENRINSNTTYFEKDDYKVIDQSNLFGNHSYFDLAAVSNRFNGTDPMQKMVDFQLYDEDKLQQFTTRDGIVTSLIWGYGKEFLVAKVVGATYAQCASLINLTTINNPLDDTALRTELNKLRTGLPGARVHSYTHKPLVGITSVVDENGIIKYFEFDSMGRLSLTRDNDGYTTDYFRYNYFTR